MLARMLDNSVENSTLFSNQLPDRVSLEELFLYPSVTPILPRRLKPAGWKQPTEKL